MNITIRYSISDVDKESQSYGLLIGALSATDMPKEIFVWQYVPPSVNDPESDALGDRFISIADPVDLSQYPVGSPDLENDIPFYRTDSVRMLFRSSQELEETAELVKADIRDLVASLKASAQFTAVEQETYS